MRYSSKLSFKGNEVTDLPIIDPLCNPIANIFGIRGNYPACVWCASLSRVGARSHAMIILVYTQAAQSLNRSEQLSALARSLAFWINTIINRNSPLSALALS